MRIVSASGSLARQSNGESPYHLTQAWCQQSSGRLNQGCHRKLAFGRGTCARDPDDSASLDFISSSFGFFFSSPPILPSCSLPARRQPPLLDNPHSSGCPSPSLVQSPCLSLSFPSSFMQSEPIAESHRTALNSSSQNLPDSYQHGYRGCDDHRVSEPLPHGGLRDPADVVASSAEGQIHASLNRLDSRHSPGGMTGSPRKSADSVSTLMALAGQQHVSLETLPNGMSSRVSFFVSC